MIDVWRRPEKDSFFIKEFAENLDTSILVCRAPRKIRKKKKLKKDIAYIEIFYIYQTSLS